MSLALGDLSRRNPAGDLHERPEACDTLVPGQRGQVDVNVLGVRTSETAGQQAADGSDRRSQRSRYSHRRFGQHEAGERDVVQRRSDHGGRPVQNRHRSIGLDEHVERVQVAVANHISCRHRRVRAEPVRDGDQILAVASPGAVTQAGEDVIHAVPVHLGQGETGAYRVGIHAVQLGHALGEQVRKPSRQSRQARNGSESAQSGEHRCSGSEVHHHEGLAETVIGSAGKVHAWGRVPLGRELGLNGRFLRGDPRVRHDACDEPALPGDGCAVQLEHEQLSPEAAGKSLWWRGELDRRDAGRVPHDPQQGIVELGCRHALGLDHGIYRNGLCCYGLVVTSPQLGRHDVSMTVDELAASARVPVRTIREYQTEGLLPPPQRRGRIGIYGASHLRRLELIGRLQQRGYSLAGIRDLVASWRDGADLGEVLGLEPDQLIEIDEPGAPATLEQLARLLPTLVPARLDELVATGLVESAGADGYCVPSPSLLQLAVSALAAGYDPDAVLTLLTTIRTATAAVADAVVTLLAAPPSQGHTEQLTALATRGRGLLAHGTGRLVVHTIGRRLGISRDDDLSAALRGLLEGNR